MHLPDELGFVHRFVAGAPSNNGLGLLLLHGTGGNESDMIPLGRTLAPGAALVSPRGKVLENGMPRFFRRLAEGVFDQDDLKLQTGALAKFIQAAARKYSLPEDGLVAVGYSNGANIASSVLLTFPRVLAAAILFRPMVPFVPASAPDLRELKVLLAAGNRDPIAGERETKRLAEIFETAGAAVTTHWHAGGHELGQDDIEAASAWIAEWRSKR